MTEDGSYLTQRGNQILPCRSRQGSFRRLYKLDILEKGDEMFGLLEMSLGEQCQGWRWGQWLSWSASTPCMHRQQEKLETILQQANYYLVDSIETQWDHSHRWSDAMDGYKLFRRVWQGRRDSGLAPYGKCFNIKEFEDRNYKVKSLCVRIRGNQIPLYMLEVQYSPEEAVWEVPGVYGRQVSVTACKWALEGGGLTRRAVHEQRRTVGDVEIRSCPMLIDHEMLEFSILGGARGRSAKLFLWTSGGQNLNCWGHWQGESLGSQSWRAGHSSRNKS